MNQLKAKLKQFVNYRNLIRLEDCELLSEIEIDNLSFKITLSPVHEGGCILWFKDKFTTQFYCALGRFSHFDKRDVLNFIVKYAISPELREEISRRQFLCRLEHLPPYYFKKFEHLTDKEKELAFMELYDLDSVIVDKEKLAIRRRLMAKKFHPDRGGDPKAMMIINEAYEFLLQRVASQKIN
jgi:hypothetical protein